MIAIVDCNNFYCSCERLFRPELDNKPVVVLSNNDGCIVSRTDEAKQLGVAMAVPYFMAKPIIEQHKVFAFSSNYSLYGDLSWRVMETLRALFGAHNIEVYSVDEAFINLKEYDDKNYFAIGLYIRAMVEQWTGIKVSIGIAPTKVLSKMANKLAKKDKLKSQCVMVLDSQAKINDALQTTPVGDVWGIGRQYATKLVEMNAIYTAYDLSRKTQLWAHKNLGGVVGVRLLKELNSEQAIPMAKEQLTQKKMIACTRMFGSTVKTIAEVKQAVATYTCRAAEKLRRQHSAATILSVFVITKEPTHAGRYRHGNSVSHYTILPTATFASHELIKPALKIVDQLFENGKQYKKAGVILSGLVPATAVQGNLFEPANLHNKQRLMGIIDNINFSMRDDLIKYAASGTKRNWKMRAEKRSPRYSTRWAEMYTVGGR